MAADLTFGPPGEQWHYTRSTRTYDLTRKEGAKTFTLVTSRGPPGTAVAIDPAHAALVVVDMQNYFLDPRCRHHPAGLACVEPTLQVIARCREIGVQASVARPSSSMTRRGGRFGHSAAGGAPGRGALEEGEAEADACACHTGRLDELGP